MKNNQTPIMKSCHIPDFENQHLLDALTAPMSGESLVVKYPFKKTKLRYQGASNRLLQWMTMHYTTPSLKKLVTR